MGIALPAGSCSSLSYLGLFLFPLPSRDRAVGDSPEGPHPVPMAEPDRRKVICLVGAGISTSAGIPDFRSPSTGLYANLEKYHLPYPEAIFEISYFKKHPEPFFALAKELYPGQFKPTICHYFIRLLKEKGLLLRCYTQNIDTLERVAGLEPQDLVEAHGTFYTSHCVNTSCRKEYTMGWMKEKIFSEATPRCEQCQSVVKPDIVFFGENLPSRFFSCMQSVSVHSGLGPCEGDKARVVGSKAFLVTPRRTSPRWTSSSSWAPPCRCSPSPPSSASRLRRMGLGVSSGQGTRADPESQLPLPRAPLATPRLLINKEKTGQTDPFLGMMMGLGGGMDFDSKKAYRDVAWLGDCDQGCLALADLLGWKKELEDLVRREHANIDAQSGSQAPNPSTTISPGKSPPPAKEAARTKEKEEQQ
eukprot:XP_017167706.1 PREDICTED: NAD-dependent protein deacetylase sirtuin-2 isoform X4 [Mus musculus]